MMKKVIANKANTKAKEETVIGGHNKGKVMASDYLKYEDYEKLLAGLRKDELYMWEAYALLAFCTALRISDTLQLTWRQVLSTDIDVVEQKTGKTRRISINKKASNRLLAIYKEIGSPSLDSYVMASPVNPSKPISREAVNAKLKQFKYKYKLPIKSFSTHTFRKTFGRHVYESHDRSAESLILLNTIFNHSNLETTKTYIGLVQDDIDDIYRKLFRK